MDRAAVGLQQLGNAASDEGLRLTLRHTDLALPASWAPPEPVDVVLLDRVLYLLGPPLAAEVLQAAVDALGPGGHLVVRDTSQGVRQVRQQVGSRLHLVGHSASHVFAIRAP